MSTNKHADYLLKRECYRTIVSISNKIFPNVKEMTESVGLYLSIANVMKMDLKRRYRAVCIGDGKYARTGLLLALMSRWDVWSVDPQLVTKEKPDFFQSVNRFTPIAKTVEALDQHDLEQIVGCDIMIAGHSHAHLPTARKLIQPKVIISMPCCEPDNLNDFCISYRDPYVNSPKNQINIYGIDRGSVKFSIS